MSILRPLIITGVTGALIAAVLLPVVNRMPSSGSAEAVEPDARPLVQVKPAETRTMKRTVRLAGTLKSGSEATLSPKQGGRVAAVLVAEGQSVRRGQVLVRMDLSDIQRQSEQAAAGVAAARANWEKAIDGEKLKRLEIDRRITEAKRGVEAAKSQLDKAEAGARLLTKTAQADIDRAQSGVDAAKSALAQAKRGARPQQRRQAEIGVQQAQRGVSLAKKNLDDLEFLHSKGGAPRIQVDEAREGFQKAQDGLAQAKAQLELVEAGATPEEIAAAEAQVRNAEAALRAAKAAAGREELNQADIAAARTQLQRAEDGLQAAVASRSELELVRSDIRAAKAAYEQAQAGARLASQQLTSGEITSPVDGIVTSVNTHAGELAGPGQPMLKIVGAAGVYLEAAAPSRVLNDLRMGQPAAVRVDSLPDRSFPGQLRTIGTVAARDGRSFPIRIDISAPVGVLKAGGFARAEVEVEQFAAAITAPVQALRADGQSTSVWVVRGHEIVEVPVQVPVQDEKRAVLIGDLRPGEPLVMSNSPGLQPGDQVETRPWD